MAGNNNFMVVIDTDKAIVKPQPANLLEKFMSLHTSYPSYLKAESPFVVFRGFAERGKSCFHATLKNESDQNIVISIRRPQGDCFFVKPKLAFIAANESITLNFSFIGRCHRVPDDISSYYTIYQLPVKKSQMLKIQKDPFSTKEIRKIWREYNRAPVDYILTMASIFGEGELKCDGHGNKDKELQLDNNGELMEEQPYDVDNDDQVFASAQE